MFWNSNLKHVRDVIVDNIFSLDHEGIWSRGGPTNKNITIDKLRSDRTRSIELVLINLFEINNFAYHKTFESSFLLSLLLYSSEIFTIPHKRLLHFSSTLQAIRADLFVDLLR